MRSRSSSRGSKRLDSVMLVPRSLHTAAGASIRRVLAGSALELHRVALTAGIVETFVVVIERSGHHGTFAPSPDVTRTVRAWLSRNFSSFHGFRPIPKTRSALQAARTRAAAGCNQR